jgi:two-component system, cell cycle response regulator DivK
MPVQDHNKTVMVVEDNQRNMKLAVDLLELNGFKVLKAASGQEALDLLKENHPDVILLDVRLPDMSGVDVYKKIRLEPRFDSVKISAFTASVMAEEKQEILKMGFNGFITKPIDIVSFIEEVRLLLKDDAPGPHEKSV